MAETARETGRITPAEQRWVLVASALIMLLVSVPYLVGLLSSTPGKAFGGFLFGLDDMYSYIAKMRYGARAGWLLQLVYTTEPHQGRLVYTHYLALGKLTALLTGQGEAVSTKALVITYHTARIVCGFVLLVVTYRFIAGFLTDIRQRYLAWIIAALGGGLGWVTVVLSPTGVIEDMSLPIEFYIPEGFSILLLYGLPHLALARSLLLGGWMLLFEAIDLTDWRRALLAGLTWAIMGQIVPFDVALLGSLIAAWLVTLWIGWHRPPWWEFKMAALAGLLPAASLLANAWAFTSEPVFAAWAAQNKLPSPAPVHYLLGYGLLIALSLPILPDLLRKGLTQHTALLLIWPPIAAVLVYLPVSVQRRLLEGVIVPLSILAVMGSVMLFKDRDKAKWLPWPVLAGILMLLLPSTAILLGVGTVVATGGQWPVFHTSEELAALGWLHDHAPADSVVVATQESGNLLPAYAGVRVYVGHGPETINAQAKSAIARAFFSGGLSDEERWALLDETSADYVWVGPPERALACEGENCFAPDRLGLRQVYQRGEYAIYEVKR